MKELFRANGWGYNDDHTCAHVYDNTPGRPARWRVKDGLLQYAFHGELTWHVDAEVFQEAYRNYLAKLVLEEP